MKISFYYVEPDYINYLKKVEIEKRGFTTVPNVEYANKNKFVYGVILKINSVDFNSSQFIEKEKIMLRKEYKACLRVISKAQKKAQTTYDRVISGKDDILIRNSCDFKLLEEACIKY